MIYKINFIEPISHEELQSQLHPEDIYLHNLTNKPTLEHNNSSITLLYDHEGLITGFEIANECTRTWNAEEDMLNFTLNILGEIETDVEIFDSTGSAETISKDELLEYYSENFKS